LFGASIACTRGVSLAELQAIARALAMLPASCALHIHSDSQAALAGIAYEGECNSLRHGSAQHQTTLVHVATNSIEFLWLDDAGGHSLLHRLRCGPCDCHLSLSHLAD